MKQLDGLAHLRGIEVQLAHDGARGGNLPLRHPAVGLGEIAHDAKSGAEKLLADGVESLRERGERLVVGILIELMARAARPGGARAARATSPPSRPPATLPIHFMHGLRV